jgi:hypothetical protein
VRLQIATYVGVDWEVVTADKVLLATMRVRWNWGRFMQGAKRRAEVDVYDCDCAAGKKQIAAIGLSSGVRYSVVYRICGDDCGK